MLVGTAVVVIGACVVAGTIVVVGAAVVVVSIPLLHADATSRNVSTTAYFLTPESVTPPVQWASDVRLPGGRYPQPGWRAFRETVVLTQCYQLRTNRRRETCHGTGNG